MAVVISLITEKLLWKPCKVQTKQINVLIGQPSPSSSSPSSSPPSPSKSKQNRSTQYQTAGNQNISLHSLQDHLWSSWSKGLDIDHDNHHHDLYYHDDFEPWHLGGDDDEQLSINCDSNQRDRSSTIGELSGSRSISSIERLRRSNWKILFIFTSPGSSLCTFSPFLHFSMSILSCK